MSLPLVAGLILEVVVKVNRNFIDDNLMLETG